MDTYCCLEELHWPTVQDSCAAGVLIQGLNGLNQSFLYVEASEDLPQAYMPDSVKCLLKVFEVVEQIVLVLQVLLYDDQTIEDLFSSAPA